MKQQPIEQRIARTRSFYKMSLLGGPLLGFFLGTYYPLNRYRGAATLPAGQVNPNDVEPAAFSTDYLTLDSAYRALPGDTIWAGSVFWGIPWIEALAGCGVAADHETGSCRSVRPDSPPEPGSIPPFDPDSPWAKKASEFLDMLVSMDAGFPIGTTLMRGVSDILSALYGSPEFVYRLIDGGEDIREVIDRIVDLWIGFARMQLDRIPRFHEGTGSYFYNLWMPGRGVFIQEDAAALLSPAIFDRSVLPAIDRIISSFDSAIIHLHPTDFIPIDSLLDTSLIAIELHIDKGGPSAEDLFPVYRKIQARKPLVIWGDLTERDAVFIRDNLDPQSLAVLPVVESVEQAECLWGLFRG